ncbi:Sulfur carrier protein ThiS (thiamine biosynthesis) [Desulfonauticus submarinus]|uniref:Sulfur carrier protein ThiS (Thiamine biosynthesis) n=1 Tax=Desulfonauticus submarinus TaxID=206665 RepID=A0A1H0EKH2_9BACT|nr:MoaD/ThiS family protein [Desulfonauticus submarinus]SDN82843.1 Sulfur carrier protein ThiS (thiamine biosynthesis) [Desulfonauticus submarinus]
MLKIKCFATLNEYSPPQGKLTYQPNMTVKDVIHTLKIPREEVKVVFVNGKHASLQTKLKDGDRIGIFPAVGGG